MKHPALTGTGRKVYLIAWAMIIIAQVFVLHYFYHISLSMAIWDGVIYNSIFLIIGIGYWYVIRYASPDSSDRMELIIVHLISCIVTVWVWLFTGSTIMEGIGGQNAGYLEFSDSALVGRIVLGVFLYTVLMLVYYLAHYYQDLLDRDVKEHELRSLLKATELRALKSQINPHFIFNSLNSISSLTITAPESARNMVIQLSDFLRYSLGNDDHQENSLAEEVNQINRYLEIEKTRFGDRLIFENQVNTASLTCVVPKLILQPLFENAIKYGVHESLEPVTVTLKSKFQEELLTLTVENNFDPDALPSKGEGIGLKNISDRLEIRYGMSGLMKVTQKNNKFTVHLHIPQTHD